jgi:hypothetical protein
MNKQLCTPARPGSGDAEHWGGFRAGGPEYGEQDRLEVSPPGAPPVRPGPVGRPSAHSSRPLLTPHSPRAVAVERPGQVPPSGQSRLFPAPLRPRVRIITVIPRMGMLGRRFDSPTRESAPKNGRKWSTGVQRRFAAADMDPPQSHRISKSKLRRRHHRTRPPKIDIASKLIDIELAIPCPDTALRGADAGQR